MNNFFRFYGIGLVMVLSMGAPVRVMATTTSWWPQVTWHTWMTRLKLSTENYDAAFQHSVKALATDPLQPELQINLGNSLEGLGSLQKAKEAYGVVEKMSSEPGLQFQSRYNQAQVLAKEKKVAEALAFYQKALELDPQSKEVKTNIELLLSGDGGSGGEGESKEPKDGEGQGKNQDGKNPQKFAENPKNQPQKSPQNLSSGDVKKILEELKQQEQRIRGDYYRQGQREQKKSADEQKREKDW